MIVVLSEKYLRSPYCMAELRYIYRQSVGGKEDFLHRIIPLSLTDARFAPGVTDSFILSTGGRSSRRWS